MCRFFFLIVRAFSKLFHLVSENIQGLKISKFEDMLSAIVLEAIGRPLAIELNQIFRAMFKASKGINGLSAT